MGNFFSSTLFLQLTGWLTLLSITTLLLSILFIPWFVGRMKKDFFIELKTKTPREQSPIWLLVLRNVFGLVLLAAGIAMLFLPGQGLITIFISLVLLSFPGKDFFILKMTSAASVRRSLNWLRMRRGKDKFIWPEC